MCEAAEAVNKYANENNLLANFSPIRRQTNHKQANTADPVLMTASGRVASDDARRERSPRVNPARPVAAKSAIDTPAITATPAFQFQQER